MTIVLVYPRIYIDEHDSNQYHFLERSELQFRTISIIFRKSIFNLFELEKKDYIIYLSYVVSNRT